ncbi:DUF11 domain-containing protein [Patescibacteria group bacterium]|nr:DUF11 domain-containing protein [Patescibacteria group bacterium]
MRNKFFFFIIILTLGLGIIGAWYYQSNIYSKEILKLEILGPDKANLLEEIEYIVKYKNNGNTRLEEPKLIFEYPKYSIVSEEKPTRQEIELEDIYPGEEKTVRFKGRLLGKEGESKTAKAWLAYQPKNLSARFEADTTFTTVINQVPLTFEFDLPSKIESGKDFSLRLNYFSNIDYPVSSLRCQIEYPSEFEFIQSTPRSLDKTEWEIGLLNKAEGGRIEVLGKAKGGLGEQKIFRAKLGSWQGGDFILLKEASKGIEIVQPSLHILQQINNNPQYIASPGDSLHYEIFFKNTGKEILNNLFLINKLEGRIFDFNSIKSEQGGFKPGDNSIVFEWQKVPELQFLLPQEEGKVEFWVNLKSENGFSGPQDKNPVIKNKVYISQAQEEFTNRVSSRLEISQKGYFQDTIFGNSGPIPPQVGESTTYTISWQVKNYYNNVRNVKIKAVLPQQVSLTGRIFPEDQSSKFAFDSISREIVWEVGDLTAGQGVLSSSPNIAFQIAFTPSASQIGQAPDLISQAQVSGEDSWTEQILRTTSPAVNTTLPDDSTVSAEQGVVQ